MPVFRINIVFAGGKRYKEHHIVDGIELDTYYRHLFRLAKRVNVTIVLFDVVQVSEFSPEAILMRSNNLRRMSRYTPKVFVRQTMGKRRRRL